MDQYEDNFTYSDPWSKHANLALDKLHRQEVAQLRLTEGRSNTAVSWDYPDP